jgi:hypothetical protein
MTHAILDNKLINIFSMNLIKPLFKAKTTQQKNIKYAAEHYYQVIGSNNGGHEYNTADLKGELLIMA